MAARAFSGLLVLVLATGCGNQFSAAAGAASGSGGGGGGLGGGSASDGGAPDPGGTGGDAGDAGDAGGSAGAETAGGVGGGTAGAGTAGGGGSQATCECTSPGHYCREGTTKCRSCTDFTNLSFAAPQKLSTLSRGSERYPRPVGSGSALLYTEVTAAESQIWYTESPASGVGTVLSGPLSDESGPLVAAGFYDQSLFFDRRTSTGRRKILMATSVAKGISAASSMLAPLPINATNSEDFSIAISAGALRAYWMSTRNDKAEPELFFAEKGVDEATVFEVQIKAGTQACPRRGADASPWVNSDGTLLLFSAESVNDNCEANDMGASDLFAVALDPSGAAKGLAVPIASLNNTGGTSNEVDPSLSEDACTLYFASDRGKTGQFELYRAERN